MDYLVPLFLVYLPLLFSLCVHEWSHARMALKKGDTLALHQGRLTLNPIAHIDIIGTLILPCLAIYIGSLPLFGWAKPVPVNPHALKNVKEDMFWIALAGPLSNALLAALGTGLLSLIYFVFTFITPVQLVVIACRQFILLNLILCFFNMIPLHPLDGAKVLARFLPHEWNSRLEEWEGWTSYILIGLIITGVLSVLTLPFYWISLKLNDLAWWLGHLGT